MTCVMECRTKVQTLEQSLKSFFRQQIVLFKLFLTVLNCEKMAIFEIVFFIYVCVIDVKTSVYVNIVRCADFYFEKL